MGQFIYVGLKQDVFDIEQVTFENEEVTSLLTMKGGACGAQKPIKFIKVHCIFHQIWNGNC
jgi:hypothetical protein